MKYRLIKRSRGWVIQRLVMKRVLPNELWEWEEHTVHRFRFIAALHLLWLRERARK